MFEIRKMDRTEANFLGSGEEFDLVREMEVDGARVCTLCVDVCIAILVLIFT